MSKQDSLQTQTCILKVNINCKCEGCEQKVKKLLQKIDGVYSVKLDAEQGKVVVAGDVDPDKLIKKLKRSGKHAEIWGGQKGVMMHNSNIPNINHQFQNLQVVDNSSKKVGKDKKSQNQKGQKVGGVDGGGVQGQVGHFQSFKGIQAQDLKVPQKEQKAVKFNLPEEDFDGSDYGSDDGFEDNFGNYSDEEEEGYGHSHPVQNKKLLPVMGNGGGPHGPVMNNHKGNGGGPHGPSGMMNGPAMNNVHKGNFGGVGVNYGGDQKKHDVVKLAMESKGKGGNSYEAATNGIKGGMNMKSNVDSRGIKDNKVEKQKKKNGKSGEGGLLGRFLSFGKKSNKGKSGGKLNKNGSENLYSKGKEEKVGGGKLKGHGNNDMSNKEHDLEFGDYDDDIPHHGKSGKGSVGNGNMAQMSVNYPVNQMGNIPAVQGLPAVNGGGGNGGGYYQGMQMQPPSYQHQQQEANMNNGYPPAMMYNRPHPSMNNYYMMPPPPMPSHPMSDPMTHTFSDENVEACSIM